MKRKLLLALAGSLFEARDATEALIRESAADGDPTTGKTLACIHNHLTADAKAAVQELEKEIQPR
jgi:hypothetical protein